MGNTETSRVRVPVGSLIAIAPPGAGKTTILRQSLTAAGLDPSRVLSRDALRVKFGNRCDALGCRAVPVSCQHHEAEIDALIEAHSTTFLAAGQSWFYDATNTFTPGLLEQVHRAHRAGLAAVALRRRGTGGQEFISLEQVQEFNARRPRRVPAPVVARIHGQYTELTAAHLHELGFDVVIDWDENTTFELMPETFDARGVDTSQFVIVGDLHGCAETFFDRLLPAVGTDADLSNPNVVIVSVGDIHDKGADPQKSVDLIRWWLRALRTGRALMVDSNHNRKLVKHLTGQDVRIGPALSKTLAAIEAQPDATELKEQIVTAFSRLPTYLWFDDLVVVHAAITEEMLGRDTPRLRSFMLYARQAYNPWRWTGSQTVVHGHDPVGVAHRRRADLSPNRPGHIPGEVINVDTGAYAGGLMTAYVHAQGSTISVEAVKAETVTRTPRVRAPRAPELAVALSA